MSGSDLAAQPLDPNTYMVIPCPQDQFGNFIAGLLGKSQIISREIIGSFSINHDEIISIFDLIQSRVNEQQVATLIQFTITIQYTDGTSIELPNMAEFQSYGEVKSLIPKGINMTWVYLVKFTNNLNPQRQQIDVNFITNNRSYYSIFDAKEHSFALNRSRYGIERLDSSLYSHSIFTGLIKTRISHTVRSWGIDIDNLIADHVKGVIGKNESGFKEFIRNFSSPITWITGIFLSMFSISALVTVLLHYRKLRIVDYRNVTAGVNDRMQEIQSKITYVGNFLIGSESVIPILLGVMYVIVATFACISISIYVSNKSSQMYPSFIVLSRFSRNYEEKIVRRYRNNIFKLIFAFAISCISGFGGNIITYYVWKG